MRGDEKLTVTLTASEWNTALALIGRAPFEVCAELIWKMREQCLAQQAPLAAGAPPARPNGEERNHVG